MTLKRLWFSFRIATQRNGYERARYLKRHNLFHHIGDNVYYQGRKLPLYSHLISIGNNVKIASRVNFITHSIIHSMLNSNKEIKKNELFQEQVGCIEIGDNVFIGAGTSILSNVKIGSNVIIAAESVITKDIQSDCVVGGVPAKVIETMEEYLQKLSRSHKYPAEMIPKRQMISKDLVDYMWNAFEEQRSHNELAEDNRKKS